MVPASESPPPQLHPAQSPPIPPATVRPCWRPPVLRLGVAVKDVFASTSEATLPAAAGRAVLGVDQCALGGQRIADFLLTLLCEAGMRWSCVKLLVLLPVLLLLLLVLLPACA